MAWLAQLVVQYALQGSRVVAVHAHSGPLRILQSLYPEGEGICHNVLVHPPGGLVGGDTLSVQVHAQEGTHGLITTPGATRFYRSQGAQACQHSVLRLEAGARLEWLPLETLAYSGCQALNRLQMHLQEGASLLGWDITALGLPHAGQPFVQGSYAQHLEIAGVWLEQGCVRAQDHLLLDGPAGLAGQRCLATMFFASGSPMTRDQRERGLELARHCCEGHELAAWAGATSPHPRLLLLRLLAPQVEPAMALMRQVRDAWRLEFWNLPAVQPRIWAM